MPRSQCLHFHRALCRKPNSTLGAGLTSAHLGTPDFDLALKQHGAYVDVLKELGLDVTVLEAEPGFPDAHFIEDTAVVTPRVAVVTRPGHKDRRGEEVSIAPLLDRYRPLKTIQAPGTLDGGDILMVGNHFFIGVSERTNAEGARQLKSFLEEVGHTAALVPVAAGLHFKSSVNELGSTLLVTEEFAHRPELDGYPLLVVPSGEEYAGNTLRINDTLITPEGYPETRKLLDSTGMPVIALDLSEMRKMDGGLTCLSLRF